jgi:hypothetical protein
MATETEEAFADPQPGDLFQEMYSFWMLVTKVTPGGPVQVREAAPPTRLSEGEGRTRTFPDADAFRRAYAYDAIPGYWIRLYERCRPVADEPHLMEAP